MKFNIRKLNQEDYDSILVDWWEGWKWTPPSKDFLPENGAGGFIVYDEDIPVCAGYIYLTNSKVGWCDWVVSNFKYKDKEKRRVALTQLVSTLTSALSIHGCKYSYALINSKSLMSIYKDVGYSEGDKYTKEMIKRL